MTEITDKDIEGVVERLQKIVDIQPEWATAYKVCTEAIAALTYLSGENDRLIAQDWIHRDQIPDDWKIEPDDHTRNFLGGYWCDKGIWRFYKNVNFSRGMLYVGCCPRTGDRITHMRLPLDPPPKPKEAAK